MTCVSRHSRTIDDQPALTIDEKRCVHIVASISQMCGRAPIMSRHYTFPSSRHRIQFADNATSAMSG